MIEYDGKVELRDADMMPAISLYQPWAEWIMLGWKVIETRKHWRFACLVGKDVLIHAAMRYDVRAIDEAG